MQKIDHIHDDEDIWKTDSTADIGIEGPGLQVRRAVVYVGSYSSIQGGHRSLCVCHMASHFLCRYMRCQCRNTSGVQNFNKMYCAYRAVINGMEDDCLLYFCIIV
jgi:hypothetical protein